MLTLWCRLFCKLAMITTRWLAGPAPYAAVWQAMRDFTEARSSDTADEIWLLEHSPVYTLGRAGLPEHVLHSAGIPVVHCDRGGQVTYHGPGQLTAYCLIDLRRYHLFVKEYVELIENVVIRLLADLGLSACRMAGAPGVYVPVQNGAPDASLPALAKIAALGIKVRNGCTYHGLALNVDMDHTPFAGINPCGYRGMATTDLKQCGVTLTLHEVGSMLAERLTAALIQYGSRRQAMHSAQA